MSATTTLTAPEPTIANGKRPSAVFHRSLSKKYDEATGGNGVYLTHPDGSTTLDGSSGAAVSCLGHGHPVVIEAIVEQAKQLAFAHSSFFTSNPAEELAQLLIDSSEGAFTKAMFLSSGSESVESAIKLARQFHLSNGQSDRINCICREYAYHGNTLGALSAGYNPPRREPFAPLLSPAFHHVAPCWYSRDARDGEDEEAYVDRLVAEYETKVEALGASTVAAVLFEPISGATLGAVPAARGYLAKMRRLCDRHGALLIYDEVMCGMGRAGTLHAWQSLGNVAPDIQCIGKGLAAGYQPVSAVLVGRKVQQIVQKGEVDHPFISGHTYQGHSIGCAAALAVQKTMVNENLLRNVETMGCLLEQELRKAVPELKEIRGLGLFRAVEFVPQKGGRIAPAVQSTCLASGAAVYLCSPAVDAIVFAPPFIISSDEILKLVRIFSDSVFAVLAKRQQVP